MNSDRIEGVFTPPTFNPPKSVPNNTQKIRAYLRREIPNVHNALVTMIDGDSWTAQAARWMVRPTISVGLGGKFSPLCYVNCSNSLGAAVRDLLQRVLPTQTEPVEGSNYVVDPVEPSTPENGDSRPDLDSLPRVTVDSLTSGYEARFAGPTTLELRPIGIVRPSIPPTGSDNAAKYPKYFKALPQGVSPDAVDTYAIAQMFPVDDPSGAILHARKKLLIPGVRSGGKSMRKDIIEARDTLNRWLELNPEE